MIDLKTYEPKGRDQQRYMDIFHDFRQIEQGGTRATLRFFQNLLGIKTI